LNGGGGKKKARRFGAFGFGVGVNREVKNKIRTPSGKKSGEKNTGRSGGKKKHGQTYLNVKKELKIKKKKKSRGRLGGEQQPALVKSKDPLSTGVKRRHITPLDRSKQQKTGKNRLGQICKTTLT